VIAHTLAVEGIKQQQKM